MRAIYICIGMLLIKIIDIVDAHEQKTTDELIDRQKNKQWRGDIPKSNKAPPKPNTNRGDA